MQLLQHRTTIALQQLVSKYFKPTKKQRWQTPRLCRAPQTAIATAIVVVSHLCFAIVFCVQFQGCTLGLSPCLSTSDVCSDRAQWCRKCVQCEVAPFLYQEMFKITSCRCMCPSIRFHYVCRLKHTRNWPTSVQQFHALSKLHVRRLVRLLSCASLKDDEAFDALEGVVVTLARLNVVTLTFGALGSHHIVSTPFEDKDRGHTGQEQWTEIRK